MHRRKYRNIYIILYINNTTHYNIKKGNIYVTFTIIFNANLIETNINITNQQGIKSNCLHLVFIIFLFYLF